ncbi:MAG: 4-hydroxythreonine-4-phosphate dehydrogenase, partial [Rubricella sp.]
MTAPLVVTLGDPAGIGPEVVAGAAKRTDAPFFVLGCAETLRVRGADIARIAHPGEAPFVPSGRIAV